MESSHSPFGLIWQIATQTGWSVKYILWGMSYPTLMLMIMDMPRYVKGGKRNLKKTDAVNYFQTRLGKVS
ncbi:hypothetical protein D0T50_09900 [Bacteroides sp. 214]|uniref:hypothetical protein n=1 Tax=Bacteroides sp. 214 TaxID=2302935 RepID=UPI0013D7403D|nr:hypothetical protein [Bacteroides sp. 214]NDW13206.1 hypothetical protein [Bacteroides sp. 214]